MKNHDPSNVIHHTAIIGENVSLGNNNIIGPYCYITGDTTIGNGNNFKAFCSIGTPAEDYGKDCKKGDLFIGNDNIFREFTTVNEGTIRSTIIANRVKMLRGSHVGHDAIINNDVVLSCNVLIGGHSMVYLGANLGLGAIVHQFSRIGAYCMIGMGAVITKKTICEPGYTFVGNPAHSIGENMTGLERNKISHEEIYELRSTFKNFKNKDNEFIY
jgi:UDP-N-acetylglucosamine acyltransferase